MGTEITMPKLSDTMTEGLFAGWKKHVGDRIERGDIIAEVETDKAVMDLEAFASGILLKTMVSGGETVAVGTVLGLIGDSAEADISASPAPSESHAAKPAKETLKSPHTTAGNEKASPLVRRLAREQGINLAQVKGSGIEGRITRDDLLLTTKQLPDEPEVSSTVASDTSIKPVASTSVSSMRHSIAQTVTESWQTIPHFSVSAEIDMEACSKIVNDLKEWHNPVGYSALAIKACAVALQKHPLLRTQDPAAPDDIDIGFAVSIPDGVMMPVIKKCQSLSVADIEIEVSRLADKCLAGRLTPEEMSGGHFSVSNLGMYGVDKFTALIMPGQIAILAVGGVSERAVARNSRSVVAATMWATLSCDHRSVDGAYAASFLSYLRSVLEKPALLLM